MHAIVWKYRISKRIFCRLSDDLIDALLREKLDEKYIISSMINLQIVKKDITYT